MQFDFSHFTRRETVDVKHTETGELLFTVVVREITHGEKTDAQKAMFGKLDIDRLEGGGASKRKISTAMANLMKSGDALVSTLIEEVSAIESWDLRDRNGVEVPVSVEAWQQLPSSLASQIEEVIERLNPDIDDDTKSESGSES